MAEAEAFRLFECFGIELEYMIVDAETLDVAPIADRLLVDARGEIENEIEHGAFAWSNELALHVVEFKTNGPSARLEGLAAGFAREITRVNELLAPHGARLLPTGMHPWMKPDVEFEIWPHGSRTIYETFDRIFDCSGHGWANLQSMHLNLPFCGDDEFGRLHAAIRALLPLLPVLAASTPFVEGRHPGTLDTRLDVYRHNARRVPSVAGRVVPEPVFTRRDYEAMLGKIHDDLAPLDPEGVLRHEWVNSRGCIARFDRNAIEIRVLDVQECPAADLAIAAAVSLVLQRLSAPDPQAQARLRALDTDRLASLLWKTTAVGSEASIDDPAYCEALGVEARASDAGALVRDLIERDVVAAPAAAEHLPALEVLLGEGSLSRRLLSRLGPAPAPAALRSAYMELADCLSRGKLFRAQP